MLMVDFDKLQIINVDDYMAVDIVLGLNPSFLDEPLSVFKKMIDMKVEEELDKHLFRKPTLFRFITRFNNDDLDIMDVNNLINALVKYLMGGARDKEPYMGNEMLGDLKEILMLDGTLNDCVNNRLDTDIFNIQVFNKNDEQFFCLTELINEEKDIIKIIEQVEPIAE